MTQSYAQVALEYARDVVAGIEPACKLHKQACQRHLDDLARADSGEWDYVFNPELIDSRGKKYLPAERVCAFSERMPHIKSDWGARGQLIKLERWQVFALAVGFGWIKRLTGKRRFRKITLLVPRKNAKSTLAAIIGLYMLAADGEFGAEVYSGATSKDQAYEVFSPARLMAIATPEFRSFYGVVPNISNLAIQDTNSKFQPVIGNPGDGASPSCAIVDEYHEHKTDELYETMYTGMGARSQPIILVISTAGANIGGPCYQHQKKLEKVLQGLEVDEEHFGIIFGIDPGDEWASEEALRKANPNYNISVSAEFLLSAMKEALADPRKQATFKTKHLNIWVASASPWINVENLQRCGDSTLSIESFAGEQCYIGNDLASKNDIASTAFEFVKEIDGEKHYYVFSKNYVPEAAVEKAENSHYRGWVVQGHLVATAGNMINLRQIEEDTVEVAEQVQVAEIAMDAWGAREMAPSLQEQGYTVIDVPMAVKYLSEPMKDIAALIDAGRFHHDGNPAFEWMMSNVEVKPDRNENIFPRKQGAEKKIDAALAVILAHSRAMLGNEAEDQTPEIIGL
ncbi:terminase large subunit [Methylobacillus flagellatus]|uniref:terminase large subunit n=1 Tax=Methylobacillus flagellatus TaxID=405 RepID=UPI0010F56AEA|nr:terminase TerL endonuclease subunit [Methylobacillus flagellatus]